MHDQSHHWSRAAASYETEFVDPFRPDVQNPVVDALQEIEHSHELTVADLGCGTGPLLPLLTDRFKKVWAIDFAEGMLNRARERCGPRPNVTFEQRSLTDLTPLHGQLDVAAAVNSLVLPDIRDIEVALDQVRRCLKPGGLFLGILPAMDGVHYYTMLLLDRALASGKPLDAAFKNVAHFAEHEYYDFAFGQFRYKGLEQHFWQPFEIRHRLRRAGFRDLRLRKVHLSWAHFSFGKELRDYTAPWDWYFHARVE